MPKVMLKKAGAAATESLLSQLMPQIDARLTSLDNSLRNLDAKVDELREDMLDRFETNVALINETNERIIRLEGKLEGYMEALRLFGASATPARPTSRKRVG